MSIGKVGRTRINFLLSWYMKNDSVFGYTGKTALFTILYGKFGVLMGTGYTSDHSHDPSRCASVRLNYKSREWVAPSRTHLTWIHPCPTARKNAASVVRKQPIRVLLTVYCATTAFPLPLASFPFSCTIPWPFVISSTKSKFSVIQFVTFVKFDNQNFQEYSLHSLKCHTVHIEHRCFICKGSQIKIKQCILNLVYILQIWQIELRKTSNFSVKI